MHYYKRNLGDYSKKAGRLSILQHGAYTLLLDSCYDRERFPTLEEAIEWTWASTTEEEEAVKFVLKRMFTLGQDGIYIQKRVEEEVNVYKIGEIKNRLIALEREAKRKTNKEAAESYKQLRDEITHDPCKKTHVAWTSVLEALLKTHEAPPNQEPLTTNQEPKKKEKIKTLMSGNTENAEKPDHHQLSEFITYLNEKTGKRFKVVEASLKFLRARLKEGHTPEDIRAVIDRKVAEWTGTKWEGYLRPSTLFNAEKFNQYVGELGRPLPDQGPNMSGVPRNPGSFLEDDGGSVIDGEFEHVGDRHE